MGKYDRLFANILSGRNDQSIRFSELTHLLVAMGFDKRTNGSHHIFYRQDIEEIINLQPKGSQAKAYQVRQVRKIIVDYRLEVPNEQL
jgi:predicted RNA binding protein YcfA (HicA-like mRNA interferase family)